MACRTPLAVLLVLLAGGAVSVDKYPPRLTSVLVNNKPPTALILPSTDDIRIFCQSEGSTPIWWKVPVPSQSFGFANGSLTIPKSKMDYRDADYYNGDYTCFTNNTLGTAVASTIRIQIGVVKPVTADQTSVNVNVGDTVVLQCRTTGVVRPSSLDSSLDYRWYWQRISNPGAFGRTDFYEMYLKTQGRIAVDENFRLFIRNVQRSDFDSSSQFIGCSTKEQIYVSAEMDVGKYSLTFVGSSPSSVAPTLVYSTKDVTVIEGGNITLSCIFNDVDGKLEGAVTWSRGYTLSMGNGARINVIDAQQQHNGTWECYYKNLKGTVNVFVKLIPRVTGMTDTYATTGGTATFICNYQFADSVLWYKNDKAVDAGRVDLTWPSNYAEEMRLRNVGKNDVGVYSCEAKNDIATIRVNGRLIVTESPSTTTWISVNKNDKLIWPITATVTAAVSITMNIIFCTCLYRLRYIRLRKGRLYMTKDCSHRSQMASTVRSLPTTDAPAETTDSLVELPYSSASEIEAPYTSLQHSREKSRIYEPLSHSKPN